MYDIYYAHHQWKYGTPIEKYEIDLIKRYFPNANVFNPSTDLLAKPDDDKAFILERCIGIVRDADILVFSSMDGMVGTGVYHEVMQAKNAGKIVFYIHQDELKTDFSLIERKESVRTNRLYGLVMITDW